MDPEAPGPGSVDLPLYDYGPDGVPLPTLFPLALFFCIVSLHEDLSVVALGFDVQIAPLYFPLRGC